MNIVNFEEELKVAQKATEEQMCLWLQLISVTVLRQHDAKYFSEFQQNQQSVYQILFGRDRNPGMLVTLYNRILQTSKSSATKHQYLDNLALLYQFVNQLTPQSQTNFNELIMSDNTYQSSISYHLLPPHLQLYVCDQTVAFSNPHFVSWQDTFVQNLFPATQQVSTPKQSTIMSRPSSSMLSPQKSFKPPSGRVAIQSYGLDIRFSTPLTFWVYLLSSLQHYKEQITTSEVGDVFQAFQDKMGSKLPLSEKVFVAMLQNPALLIIRRILANMCSQIESTEQVGKLSPLKSVSHQQLLQLLSKMIILVQEYTLYSCVLQLNPNELKLSQFQAQNFLRLRTAPFVLDVHLQVIYTLVVLNAQHGAKMESQYQQFAQIYLNNHSRRTQQQQQNVNKSFFFTAGRQGSQFSFQQALYRLLSYGLQHYAQDKQYSPISLQSYVSLWVLYARWPFARHEPQIVILAEIFDQMMQQYLDELMTSQLELSGSRQRVSLWGQIVNLYNSLKWKAVKRFNYINYTFKLNLLKGTRPPNKVKYQAMERKDPSAPYNYHYGELKPKLSEFHHFLRMNYPFYTILFNKMMKCVSGGAATADEMQALIHMVSFVGAVDPTTNTLRSLYLGGIRLVDVNGFDVQQPNLSELSSVCEYFESDTQSPALYQMFNNQCLVADVQKVVLSLIAYANDNQSAMQVVGATIHTLELLYGLEATKQDLLRRKITPKLYRVSAPQRYSCITNPNSQIMNQWQIPPKDTDVVFLLHLLRYVSFGLDRVTCRRSVTYDDKYRDERQVLPATQWPRLLANFDNLKICLILGLFFYLAWVLFGGSGRRK